MSRYKNRDRVAGPNDLTVSDLKHHASNSEHPADRAAHSVLKDMTDPDIRIDWNTHNFRSESGTDMSARDFMQKFGNHTPITRTLVNYIQPLVVGGAETSPNLGNRVITRSADPELTECKFPRFQGPRQQNLPTSLPVLHDCVWDETQTPEGASK